MSRSPLPKHPLSRESSLSKGFPSSRECENHADVFFCPRRFTWSDMSLLRLALDEYLKKHYLAPEGSNLAIGGDSDLAPYRRDAFLHEISACVSLDRKIRSLMAENERIAFCRSCDLPFKSPLVQMRGFSSREAGEEELTKFRWDNDASRYLLETIYLLDPVKRKYRMFKPVCGIPMHSLGVDVALNDARKMLDSCKKT